MTHEIHIEHNETCAHQYLNQTYLQHVNPLFRSGFFVRMLNPEVYSIISRTGQKIKAAEKEAALLGLNAVPITDLEIDESSIHQKIMHHHPHASPAQYIGFTALGKAMEAKRLLNGKLERQQVIKAEDSQRLVYINGQALLLPKANNLDEVRQNLALLQHSGTRITEISAATFVGSDECQPDTLVTLVATELHGLPQADANRLIDNEPSLQHAAGSLPFTKFGWKLLKGLTGTMTETHARMDMDGRLTQFSSPQSYRADPEYLNHVIFGGGLLGTVVDAADEYLEMMARQKVL